VAPVDRLTFRRRFRATGVPIELVDIWFGDSIAWARDDFGDEHQVDREPDVTVTRAALDHLVIEWLRGPAGDDGVMGPTGPAGKDAYRTRTHP
jgi:hypothetical protein